MPPRAWNWRCRTTPSSSTSAGWTARRRSTTPPSSRPSGSASTSSGRACWSRRHGAAGGPTTSRSSTRCRPPRPRRGIKLQLTITGPAPASATADHKIGGNRPDPVKFAAFARAVAAHFKGRVDRYSIWNEPNLSAWLSPSKSAPQLYRSLYTAGYTAIKTVDPNAKVLFGELAPNRDGRTIAPLKFLRDVTCSKANYKAARKCAPLKADGLALHPYQLTKSPPITSGGPDDAPISQLSRITKALDKLAKRRALATPNKRGLDLYLTEFGYLSAGGRKQSREPPLRLAELRLQDRPQEPAREAAAPVPARRSARPRAVALGDPRPPRAQVGAVRGPRPRCLSSLTDTIAPSSSREESLVKTRAAMLTGDRPRLGGHRAGTRRSRAGEVLIRWVASGLCHSDDHLRTGDIVPRFPIVGGHEGAGIIEKVGPGVTRVAEGDHVVTSFLPACGHCRWCATGHSAICDVGALITDGCLPDGTFRFHDNGDRRRPDVHARQLRSTRRSPSSRA